MQRPLPRSGFISRRSGATTAHYTQRTNQQERIRFWNGSNLSRSKLKIPFRVISKEKIVEVRIGSQSTKAEVCEVRRRWIVVTYVSIDLEKPTVLLDVLAFGEVAGRRMSRFLQLSIHRSSRPTAESMNAARYHSQSAPAVSFPVSQ